ncbi:MAG: hypothetical protein KKE17_04460 [Proteobacteria bacterium]|nr:hypothetical protein [Pseudomonadota bacterium]MBU1709239.1 hypothetical protein [Pseudomonadota bacterium]
MIKPIRYLKQNFSAKVFFYIFCGMIIIFSSLNLFFIHLQRQTLEQNLYSQGVMHVKNLAYSTRLGVFTENHDMLVNLIDGVLFNTENSLIQACILSSDGAPLTSKRKDTYRQNNINCAIDIYSPEELMIKIKDAPNRLFILEHADHIEFWSPILATSSLQTYDSLYFDTVNENVLHKQRVIGAIGVTIDKAPLKKGLETILKRTITSGIFFLFLAGIITYLITREVTAPLKKLIHRVEERGIVIEAANQLDLLEGTFNNLVRGLEESITTIANLKENLELKVDERTHALLEHSVYLEKTNQELEKTLRRLKEAQTQLVHSEKMAALGQLVAGVAHEINNTTNFISGALPPLTRGVNDLNTFLDLCNQLPEHSDEDKIIDHFKITAKYRKDFQFNKLPEIMNTLIANIAEGTQRTTQIVQDLKNFSRPEEDLMVQTDINKNLESTLTLLHNEYKYNIEIFKNLDQTLPTVSCYPSQLNQVFLNILLNSIQSIKGKGVIWISTWLEGEFVHIRIKDNGCGIPDEIREKIFDPFFTTKEVGQGTGLGLSISYGIIQKHSGKIKVNSQPQKGTEMEIIIPTVLKKSTIEYEEAHDIALSQ